MKRLKYCCCWSRNSLSSLAPLSFSNSVGFNGLEMERRRERERETLFSLPLCSDDADPLESTPIATNRWGEIKPRRVLLVLLFHLERRHRWRSIRYFDSSQLASPPWSSHQEQVSFSWTLSSIGDNAQSTRKFIIVTYIVHCVTLIFVSTRNWIVRSNSLSTLAPKMNPISTGRENESSKTVYDTTVSQWWGIVAGAAPLFPLVSVVWCVWTKPDYTVRNKKKKKKEPPRIDYASQCAIPKRGRRRRREMRKRDHSVTWDFRSF